MERTAADLQAAQQQIARATSSLQQLQNQSAEDLRPRFEAFDRAVTQLERSASALDRQAGQLREERLAYLDRWEQQNRAIRSDEVRRASLERRDEVAEELVRLEQDFLQARARLEPLVRDLQDIRRMLSVDLTPAGLATAQDLVERAREDAEPVRSALADLEQDLRTASLRLYPEAGRAAE